MEKIAKDILKLAKSLVAERWPMSREEKVWAKGVISYLKRLDFHTTEIKLKSVDVCYQTEDNILFEAFYGGGDWEGFVMIEYEVKTRLAEVYMSVNLKDDPIVEDAFRSKSRVGFRPNELGKVLVKLEDEAKDFVEEESRRLQMKREEEDSRW